MKMQSYSPEDIFEKQLLMLTPFYIFSHEDSFADYNGSSHRLTELQNEYKKILDRLNNLEEQGIIGAFDKRTIIELSSDVIKEITQKYESVEEVAEYSELAISEVQQLAKDL